MLGVAWHGCSGISKFAGQLSSLADLHLFEDVPFMGLHSKRRNEQLFRDLLAGVTLGDQMGDFELPLTECGNWIVGRDKNFGELFVTAQFVIKLSLEDDLIIGFLVADVCDGAKPNQWITCLSIGNDAKLA